MAEHRVITAARDALASGRSMFHCTLNLSAHFGPQPKLATINLVVDDPTEVLSELHDMGWELVTMSTHVGPQFVALGAVYAFRRR